VGNPQDVDYEIRLYIRYEGREFLATAMGNCCHFRYLLIAGVLLLACRETRADGNSTETAAAVAPHPGFDLSRYGIARMRPYDPTNGTFAIRPARFESVLNLVVDEATTLPTRIVFDVTERHAPTTATQPRTWHHVISDREEIQAILDAMASATLRPDAYWWRSISDAQYIYLLTLDFGGFGEGTWPMLNKITLNLSRMIGNGYHFEALENVLAKYPPGFQPQARAVLQ
jgi:hypothetical protein